MSTLFGVIIPYAAIVIFILGLIYRIVGWGRSAVPFRIPTTGGQQKSLPWIKNDPLDNPPDNRFTVGRMALEILLFRSLWRNNRAEVKAGKEKLIYSNNKFLWLMGLLFHYSLLVILIRHLRLFIQPVPWVIVALTNVDSAIKVLFPTLFISDIVFVIAIMYLLFRRIGFSQMRYISLPADYFALVLLGGIATTGMLMRVVYHPNIVAVKELAMSVLRFDPSVPHGLGWLFYFHLTLVSLLLAYFPFSKMVHMSGIFFSPTRNMASNNRAVRHVNPWDYPVKVHPYAEYEEEFHDKMAQAGLPLEKE